MLRLEADENFNADVVRGLLRRIPALDVVRVRDVGLSGTIDNVVNLCRDHKSVAVYVSPVTQFRTIKTFEDLKGLLAQGDSDCVERIINELDLEVSLQRAAG